MPATSHHVDRAAGAPGSFLPNLPALPQGRRPRARPSAEFQSVHPGGERRPGLFPGSVRNRGASFSFGLSPAQLESFIFFSHLYSFWSFKLSLFFFRFVCCYSLRPFPPSPVTRFVRSPVAFGFFCFVFSFFIFSFPFLLSLPTASTSRFRLSHPLLCSISFPLLLVAVYSLVFFLRISLWAPHRRCVPPPLVLPQCSSQFARRRTGPGAPPSLRDPARPAGTRARGVGPDRRRAPSQAAYLSPAVLSALRDRRLWLGSEEPGQLLRIKSQLWFLSGEPLSKGIDTKLRGLTHFLR